MEEWIKKRMEKSKNDSKVILAYKNILKYYSVKENIGSKNGRNLSVIFSIL